MILATWGIILFCFVLLPLMNNDSRCWFWFFAKFKFLWEYRIIAKVKDNDGVDVSSIELVPAISKSIAENVDLSVSKVLGLKEADDLKKCDTISNLPDEMLVHILSFLPTKESFRTSVLSYRWKNLWTLVPNLEFRPNLFCLTGCDMDEKRRYIDFIERIFVSHNSSINKVHLSCPLYFDTSVLKAWISTMVEHNVQDLQIVCFDKQMELPESLFTCKTLLNLKLHCVRQHDVPASIYFPCLKVLHINLFSPSSILTQKLFCSSPVLEELRIDACYVFPAGEYVYNISSPYLKKLFVRIDSINKGDYFNCVVNVNAPILDSLEVTHDPCVHFVLKKSTALVKARLVFYKRKDGSKLIRLLKSVSYVKDLSLGGDLATVVIEISSEKNCPTFPFVTHLTLDMRENLNSRRLTRCIIFPNLIHLRLALYNNFSVDNLPKILTWAPSLSTLVIANSPCRDEIIFLEHSKVPSCLCCHVKEIKLLAFHGYRSELKMIKYLLESAGALEKLTVMISCHSCDLKEVPELERQLFKREIVTLARSLKECKLLFI